MFALHLVSVLATLLSISAAAPTTDDCSQLTRNLTANELHQILGTWIHIEGFSNNDFYDSILENLENSWMRVNTTADNHTLLIEQGMPDQARPFQSPTPDNYKRDTMVQTHETESSMQQNSCQCNHHDDSSLEILLKTASIYFRFLQTCPECLVIFSYNKVNDYQALYIYGRNKTLAASDLETFRKQATCLQFPQPPKFHYNPSKELCPM